MERETAHEWRVLKGLAFQFALENQGFGDEKFIWSRNASQPRLSLGNVTVTFSDRGERNGTPQNCCVLFSSRAATSDDNLRAQEQTWSLIPEIRTGEFAWKILELGKLFSPAQLAEELATELTRRYLQCKIQPAKAVGI